MRLGVVDHGHDERGAEVLAWLREQRGSEPSGVLKTLQYRPELFGRPFSAALQEAMRGPSKWTSGERELFAALTSSLNHCPF
jgi:hypothetical protein